MTDIAFVQRPSDRKSKQADRNYDDIADLLTKHNNRTAASVQELDGLRAILLRNATAQALGQDATETPPDPNRLEQLSAAVAVSEPVKLQLEGRLAVADRERTKERANLRYEQLKYLKTTALQPALQEFDEAFGNLRDAATKVIAAHFLVHRELDDRWNPTKFTPMEQYGPVAEWLHAIYVMNWERYPYDIQPDWLPRQGKFWPDELPGVNERIAELRAEVAQVSE